MDACIPYNFVKKVFDLGLVNEKTLDLGIGRVVLIPLMSSTDNQFDSVNKVFKTPKKKKHIDSMTYVRYVYHTFSDLSI